MPVVSDNKFFSKLSNCFLVYHEELNFPYNRHTGIQNSKPFTESKTKCPIGYLKFRLFSFFLKVYAQNIKIQKKKMYRSHVTHSNLPKSQNCIIIGNLPTKLCYLTNIDRPYTITIFSK